MNIKQYYEETKPKLAKNDFIMIYADEILPNGQKLNHNVELPYDLEKYPKIKEINIIESHIDICDFTCGNTKGKLKEYIATIKYEDLKKAKGLTE